LVGEGAFSGDWKTKARARIKKCGQMIVLCGEHTHTATGVAAELEIAQEEKLSYFLLAGYPDKTCTKPTTAKSTDSMYKWTWTIEKAHKGRSLSGYGRKARKQTAKPNAAGVRREVPRPFA